MKCPYCKHQEDRVLDSRTVRDGDAIKRRRECISCGRRYTTYEQIEEMRLMVVKKDLRREPFDRAKTLKGMIVACEKRPVSIETLERAVEEIELSFLDRGVKEICSEEIGELVIEELRKLDKVAFVRFASVYRQFEDVTQFKELVDVLDRPKRN